MQFKRDILPELIKWKNSKDRKPLLLKGARQVGKTSLLKEFGKDAFKEVAYFNFEENPGLKQFFENTKDVKRIINNLSLVHGSSIQAQDTLIIFDEIQECNLALNTLKYFCENAPEYAIASAGSLLGITLGKEASFPVGKVDFIDIYPLTFIEFLNGFEPKLAEYMMHASHTEPIPDIFFHSLLEKFKMYFISGGMPEAARKLVAEKSVTSTQHILKTILTGYALDFSIHAPSKDIARIGYVWNSIPSHLARENKKFLYQTVKPGAKSREYEDALLWLIQAGLIYKVSRCAKPNLPLSAYDDLSAFKLYLFDIGLLRNLAQLDHEVISNGNTLFTEFKGSLSENYILQSLISQFDSIPRYWTSEGKAEIDFILQYKNIIIPIEVKSDENIRSKSMTFYHQKYDPSIRIRFSLRNFSFKEGLLNIPLFMADQTKRILENVLTEI